MNLSDSERGRLIRAEWENPTDAGNEGQYLAELKMFAEDKQGLLMDISRIFTEAKIDVKSMNVRTSKKGTATIEMGFIVHAFDLHGNISKIQVACQTGMPKLPKEFEILHMSNSGRVKHILRLGK